MFADRDNRDNAEKKDQKGGRTPIEKWIVVRGTGSYGRRQVSSPEATNTASDFVPECR